ncbi:MAG: precorrin-6y C5,15-methyltransferase (decarboxylating) subunit CbiE [Lachnospiraceae bacterium]|nr:precorrin-6y C5,15-methyltransferase (decarboxylating) subunit CbiE [Lachnospiraceae bacterium]
MIYLIGAGMGDTSLITGEGLSAIRSSDILTGNRRLTDILKERYPEKKIYITDYAPKDLYCTIREHTDISSVNISVIYSGDTGFYSGAAGMASYLAERSIPYCLICGISTYQYLAAKLNRTYENWSLLSAHGRDMDPCSRLMEGKPVFFLTSGKDGVRGHVKKLIEAEDNDIRITLAKDLSYENERIICGKPQEIMEYLGEKDPLESSLYAVLMEADRYPEKYSGAIPDEEFIRSDAPLTKQAVRSHILSLLRISKEDICLDIGAGTGGVTIDMAMNAGRVFSVEIDSSRADTVKKNKEHFRAYNTVVIRSDAKDVLEKPESFGIKNVNKIYIGGSKGDLYGIIKLVNRKFPDATVVFCAITIESLLEGTKAFEEDRSEYSILKSSAARSYDVSGRHMMKNDNDIYLITKKGK